MKSKHFIRPALATAFLLLIPFVAMRFSDEVNWSVTDFVIMGALVFAIGLAFELIAGKTRTIAYRAAAGVALAASFLLVWINLAVGIIGSENNPANLMYFAVVLIAVVGAAVARLRPLGMARAMSAAAAALALVPLIARVTGSSRAMQEPPGVWGVLALNAFFVLLFVASALLFRRAAAANAGSDG